MTNLLADPAALIIAAIGIVLLIASILCDLWTADDKPDNEHRCPRCGSRHHTDCNEP